jgi:hypothetical protein
MRFKFPNRQHSEPTTPSVGIFYLVGSVLLIDSTPVAQAGVYGEFRIHERSHLDYWAELVNTGKVPHAEYEESPRGRVGYHPKSHKFGLLADSCILTQEKMLGMIFFHLCIPLKNTVIGTDSHYCCFRCLGLSR